MIIPQSTPLVNLDGSEYTPLDNVLVRYKPCGTFSQDVIVDYFKTIKDNEWIEDGNNIFDFLLNVNLMFLYN